MNANMRVRKIIVLGKSVSSGKVKHSCSKNLNPSNRELKFFQPCFISSYKNKFFETFCLLSNFFFFSIAYLRFYYHENQIFFKSLCQNLGYFSIKQNYLKDVSNRFLIRLATMSVDDLKASYTLFE